MSWVYGAAATTALPDMRHQRLLHERCMCVVCVLHVLHVLRVCCACVLHVSRVVHACCTCVVHVCCTCVVHVCCTCVARVLRIRVARVLHVRCMHLACALHVSLGHGLYVGVSVDIQCLPIRALQPAYNARWYEGLLMYTIYTGTRSYTHI